MKFVTEHFSKLLMRRVEARKACTLLNCMDLRTQDREHGQRERRGVQETTQDKWKEKMCMRTHKNG